jgi:hypothetical protein
VPDYAAPSYAAASRTLFLDLMATHGLTPIRRLCVSRKRLLRQAHQLDLGARRVAVGAGHGAVRARAVRAGILVSGAVLIVVQTTADDGCSLPKRVSGRFQLGSRSGLAQLRGRSLRSDQSACSAFCLPATARRLSYSSLSSSATILAPVARASCPVTRACPLPPR